MKTDMAGRRDGTGHTPLGVSRLSHPCPARVRPGVKFGREVIMEDDDFDTIEPVLPEGDGE